ncbi:UNVERIFIED_CONTAM: Retrovirus-related Pol polyprotein from transposon opus [Sesamum calycinum]|uniref:Retrovirus-related Pol polyprotein from transposon opus n=1 Tax=Sesamum calycinum TaxID=2727403 RepID=A0AAW2KPR3_9LAMI
MLNHIATRITKRCKMISEMLHDGNLPAQALFLPLFYWFEKKIVHGVCVDYRALNAVTVRNRFPIPTVDELLDELHGPTIFSKLDLRAGYHHIRLAPSDIHKTAFSTVDGHFEFLDILVYSKDWPSHLLHLRLVLQVLSDHCLFAKSLKCLFGVDSVDYLGHTIFADGLAANSSKLRAIADWPAPSSFTALRGFFGITGYYRRFVWNYASIAAPLTNLLKQSFFLAACCRCRISGSSRRTPGHSDSAPAGFLTSLRAGQSLLHRISHSPSSKLTFSDVHGLVLYDSRDTRTDGSPLPAALEISFLCRWRSFGASNWPATASADTCPSVGRLEHGFCYSPPCLQWPHGYLGGYRPIDEIRPFCGSAYKTYSPISGRHFCRGDLPITRHAQVHHSDRDPLFLSRFWSELFRISGTKLAYSSAYHPQSDGQNRVIETYIRCFVSDEPRLWFQFLHLAEFWYNSSHHSSIGMTPFQALYGRPPPSLSSYVAGTTTVADLDESHRRRHSILSMARYHLARTRLRMKQQVDRHRRDLSFAVGDWVLLRLQPYRQLSIRGRKFQKLAPRFFGPFCVLRRLGPVAYELSLPPESRIHPLPDPVPALIPSAILSHRTVQTTDGARSQVLVHWADQSEADASWVSTDEFVASFPNFDLEGKVVVGAPSIDTTQIPKGLHTRDPEEFQPERFMTSNGGVVDVSAKTGEFEMIPFGGGRRGCPGTGMGLISAELALANLLYSFDWTLPAAAPGH